MSPTVGFLYRRYLRGDDLDGQVFTVKIKSLELVEVQPHPAAPRQEKWCLQVAGLPEEYPTGILFGPRNEGKLVDIFGNVDTAELINKPLEIYPYEVKIGGQKRRAIGFRGASAQPSNNGRKAASPASKPQEAVPTEPDVDNIPF